MDISYKTSRQYTKHEESKMMDERLVDFAKKAVKLKSWRWIPGMLGVRNCAPDKLDYLKPEIRIRNISDMCTAETFGCIPDLTDPATLGAILQLIRVAAKDETVYLCYFDGYDSVEWGVVSPVIEGIREELELKPDGWFRSLIGDASTEGVALILALQESEEFYARQLAGNERER